MGSDPLRPADPDVTCIIGCVFPQYTSDDFVCPASHVRLGPYRAHNDWTSSPSRCDVEGDDTMMLPS